MRTTRSATVAAVFLALGVVLAGCASAQPTGANSNPPVAPLSPIAYTPQADDPVVYQSSGAELLADGTPVLPLDGYSAYAHPDDIALIAAAATRAEQACMHSRGAQLPPGFAASQLPDPMPTLAYYGVTTLTQAQKDGYRLIQASSPDSAPLPAKTAADLYGTNGCAQSAGPALGLGLAEQALNTVQDLRAQALEATWADPRLKAANVRWSTCMQTAGYAYPDPLAPGRDRTMLGRGLPIPKGATLPPVSPYERSVAEADVTCKQHTSYLQTYLRIAAEHQNQLITQNQKNLQQALHDWQTVLINARRETGT